MAKLEPTHNNVLKDLQESQKADHDNRERAREADHFINKRDGQWEPEVIRQFTGKPRYTIDLTSGIVNDAHGEMSSMDFDIKVTPAGGPATTQIALHYDGLIRNIENNSGNGAKYIYRAAGKQMLTSGIGGWGIKHDYRDPLSFDQDLMVYPISNFMDRVWLDPSAEEQDGSDSDWGFKLTSMSKKKYDQDFPKGSQMSIGRDLYGSVYSYKKSDAVVVAEHFWKKYETVDIVLMTNGSVFIDDEEFKSIKDELQYKGVTVEKSRTTRAARVYHRLLDGQDFLTDAAETVFTYIPLIPVYGNYEISEDKMIYWGLVEKHMDPQRILNYVESRKVEEGALAPRIKIWMTAEQVGENKSTIQTLNTNTDPVQLYNHIEDVPPPYETGGAKINPGLSETSRDMKEHMASISGRLDPSGNPDLGLQSGVALEVLQNKGDTGNMSYFTSMEIAISHTCRVIGDAIPRVYDARREIQLDGLDGTSDTITINERIYDNESGKIVEINDLSKGTYSFTCSAGPAFSNRQQETVRTIENIARIDPSILELGKDVYLSNIPAPGMEKIAKRTRAAMIKQGLIPEDELTKTEKQAIANQPPPEPSAMDKALIAEAQATAEKTKANTADILSKIDERGKKLELAVGKLQLDAKKVDGQMQIENNKLVLEAMKAQDEQIKVMAETLKTIKEAIGAEVIMGPDNTSAYKNQSESLNKAIKASE